MSALLSALLGFAIAQGVGFLLRARMRALAERPVFRARHGRGLARHGLHQ